MSGRDSWKTWILVVGLLLFAGVASAGWIWLSSQSETNSAQQPEVESEPVVITIEVEDLLLGDELMKIPFISTYIDGLQFAATQAIMLAAAITVAGIVALTIPLAALTFVLDRQAKKVREDESFQAAEAELDQREAARLKDWRQERPLSDPATPEQVGRWSMVATSIVIIIFVWLTGFLVGSAFFEGRSVEIGGRIVDPATILNAILILATIVVLYLVVRRHRPTDLDSGETDYSPVNWGWVWVVLSGLLIFGLGTGLAIAVRSAG